MNRFTFKKLLGPVLLVVTAVVVVTGLLGCEGTYSGGGSSYNYGQQGAQERATTAEYMRKTADEGGTYLGPMETEAECAQRARARGFSEFNFGRGTCWGR
jgi:hypothetical protein